MGDAPVTLVKTNYIEDIDVEDTTDDDDDDDDDEEEAGAAGGGGADATSSFILVSVGTTTFPLQRKGGGEKLSL